MVADHGVLVPPDVAAAFGSLATLEGTVTLLDPGFDMIEEARQLARTLLTSEPTSSEQLIKELLALLPELRTLPGRLLRTTNALDRGELGVRVRQFGDERDRRFIARSLQQVLLTVLAATAGVLGVLLLGAEGGPDFSDSVGLFDLVGYNLVLVAVIVMLRALFMTFDRER